MLLLFLACSLSGSDAAPAGPPPAPVSVTELRRGDLSDTSTLLGEVRALERAELAAGADGPLSAVNAREGDRVARGDVLAEVDSSLARAELGAARAAAARAEAELAQARRTQQRVDGVREGVMAADEIDQARARVDVLAAQKLSADAAVQLAGARLARHRVVAPFDGVVARRHADPGDWVAPGRAVIDLVRVDPVEVVVDVPAHLAGGIAVGDHVEVGGASGSVVGVVPSLESVSRTARVRIAPEGEGSGLIPGGSVPVTFAIAAVDGLVVSRDAVVLGPTDRVFRVVDGKAQSIDVVVVASTGDEVMLTGEGLGEGDSLVIRGNERLRPDQAVTVAP